MKRKEIIAMLLAGGQGSRLGILTKNIAKPAVPYGGKYRIIDFSLSNCINSGIDTVGILTQYQPLKLNYHIGIGKPWDMDRMNGGVTILSPYTRAEIGEWYKGTANAIYQNIHYIHQYSPTYIVILSGDHIYKMDYSSMLSFHKENHADATISVIEVPWEEAGRYGIMNMDRSGRIFEFEEKPKEPKSNLASMGVYIFTWETLREYLTKDNDSSSTSNDFGKDIIPAMLRDGRSMWGYKFDGYWKDVGTIQAYWESNMDLIKRVPPFNLYDPNWKIYTRNPVQPAHYIGNSGRVTESVISEGSMIYGTVTRSVISPGVVIEEGAVVEDSIVMSFSKIGRNTVVHQSIIGENVLVGHGAAIGAGESVPNEAMPRIYHSGISVIGENARIPDGCTIGKNVMIDIDVQENDFAVHTIPSGKNVYKGGDGI